MESRVETTPFRDERRGMSKWVNRTVAAMVVLGFLLLWLLGLELESESEEEGSSAKGLL